MKFILPFLLLPIFSSFSYSQDNISILLLEKVNHLRDSLNLQELEYDKILSLAGEDHSYYISRKNRLTHFQKTFTKETPAERVIFYKGNRTYVGENIAQIKSKYAKNALINEKHIAQNLYTSWLNSLPHYQNLINPIYTKMGLGYSISYNGKLYAAQVFSSDEINLPKSFKNSDLSWGVRATEHTCKDQSVTYETMFFANSVEVEGNSIYLNFHDKKFFQNVIKNDNDGLAIDIILREQVPCGKENQFHISTIYDGEMQRPIYKNDIYRFNLSNNPKKIKVKIGEVPVYLRNQKWEANIIIINNNKLCDYSYPIEIPSDIFPLLKIKPYYEIGDSNNYPIVSLNPIHIKDSIHVELMYQRSKNRFFSLNSKEFTRLLNWNRFIQHVDVNCFASVEGATWYNQQLLDDRKKDITTLLSNNLFDLNKVKITTSENWDLMNLQLKQKYLPHLKSKSKTQIKYFFKHNKSDLIDSLLFAQRKTHVYAKVDTLLKINSYDELYFASFYDTTLNLSILPWNSILKNDYILKEQKLASNIIDSLKNRIDLRTNLLATVSIKNTAKSLDSTLVDTLLNKIDTNNSIQIFNYGHFLTKYWFAKFSTSYETKGVSKTITPDSLRILLSKIDTTEIAKDDLSRLQINLLLSGIHYYVTYNNWLPVDNYFKAISELVKLNNFTPQEAMELALFCNHFHKFSIAVEILHPFHENKTLSEDAYFILAKTSTLIRDVLDEKNYHAYMESAKIANHSRYCKWLDNSFQIQRDEYIKNDFCKECN